MTPTLSNLTSLSAMEWAFQRANHEQ